MSNPDYTSPIELPHSAPVYKPPKLDVPIESYRRILDSSATLTAKHTFNLLNMYLLGELRSNAQPAIDYFANDTLGYIKDGLEGFSLTAHKIPGRAFGASQTDLLMTRTSSSDNTKSIEAFRHMVIVFSYLPTAFEGLHPGMEYAQERNLVRSPENTGQLRYRIQELKEEVEELVKGETMQDTPVDSSDSLFRTYAFFLASSKLADRLPRNVAEVNEELREYYKRRNREYETSNRLLKDIDL